jgi:hypothetical protein
MNNQITNTLTNQEILDFAQMAKSAYGTADTIQSQYGSQYRIVIKNPPRTQGQCVLLFNDAQQEQYIISRGSSNLENFFKDGEYLKKFDNKTGIYLHSGFWDSAVETYNYILPELEEEYLTFITGHSLGGAIALILHLYLLIDGFPIKQSVTFGQPMASNQDGVNKYRGIPLLRVVHKKDPIPLVPPLTLASSENGSYYHLGEEVILLNGIYYCHLDEADAENPTVSDFWANLIKGETSIFDHDYDLYVSNLQAKLIGCSEITYDQRESYLD